MNSASFRYRRSNARLKMAFFRRPASKGRLEQSPVHRDAVRRSHASEMRRQRDVLRDVDRVEMDDVRLPRQNLFRERRLEVSCEEPFAKRAVRSRLIASRRRPGPLHP